MCILYSPPSTRHKNEIKLPYDIESLSVEKDGKMWVHKRGYGTRYFAAYFEPALNALWLESTGECYELIEQDGDKELRPANLLDLIKKYNSKETVDSSDKHMLF